MVTGLLLCTFAVAGIVQRITGFGFGLVAVPMLALVIEPSLAIVLATLAAGPMAACVALGDLPAVQWGLIGRLTVGTFLGAPIGALLLVHGPERLLTLLVGVSIIAFLGLTRTAVRVSQSRFADLGTGVASGALGLATGMGGPPVVMLMRGRDMVMRDFRATISLYVGIQGLIAATIFGATGLLTFRALGLSAVGLVVALIAGAAAARLLANIDQRIFRRVVDMLLLACAVTALLSTVR